MSRSRHRTLRLTPGHYWVVMLIKLVFVVGVVLPALAISCIFMYVWLTRG